MSLRNFCRLRRVSPRRECVVTKGKVGGRPSTHDSDYSRFLPKNNDHCHLTASRACGDALPIILCGKNEATSLPELSAAVRNPQNPSKRRKSKSLFRIKAWARTPIGAGTAVLTVESRLNSVSLHWSVHIFSVWTAKRIRFCRFRSQMVK